MVNKELTGDDLIIAKPDYTKIGLISQYLVFPDQETLEEFESKVMFKVLIDASKVRLNNLGSMFKIRASTAFWPSTDRYFPEIRCGVTGKSLWKSNVRIDDQEEAFQIAIQELKSGFGTKYHVPENYQKIKDDE